MTAVLAFLWMSALSFAADAHYETGYVASTEFLKHQVAGTIYLEKDTDSKESQPSKPLFTFERLTEMKDGILTATRIFKDAETKKVALTERNKYRGGVLLQHEWIQNQTNEKALVTFEKGKAFFHYEKPGDVDDDEEDLDPNTITNDQLGPLLRTEYTKLLADHDVSVRLVVPFRTETVGFTLSNDGFETRKENGIEKKYLVIKLAPSSFIIKLIVSPLRFYADTETGIVRYYTGRSAVKRMKPGEKEFEDFDSEMEFSIISTEPKQL